MAGKSCSSADVVRRVSTGTRSMRIRPSRNFCSPAHGISAARNEKAPCAVLTSNRVSGCSMDAVTITPFSRTGPELLTGPDLPHHNMDTWRVEHFQLDGDWIESWGANRHSRTE